MRRRARYGAKACAAVLGIVALTALTARFAFPDYPTCGPHEALVLLMLAPTVIGALTFVAWPHCRRKSLAVALLPLAGILAPIWWSRCCDGVKSAMLAGDAGLARVGWEGSGKLLDGDGSGREVEDLGAEREWRERL